MRRLHYAGYVWDGTGLRPASPHTTEVPRRSLHQPLVLSGDETARRNLLATVFVGGILALVLWKTTERPRGRS